MNTPWGRADYVKEIAPGVREVSTPGHGGFWLSKERLAAMPAALRHRTPFYNGGNWFEEDCEWARVALAFPGLFTGRALKAALKTMRHFHPGILRAFVRGNRGRWELFKAEVK